MAREKPMIILKKAIAITIYLLGAVILTTKVIWPMLESRAGPLNRRAGLAEPGTLLSFRSDSILGAFTKASAFAELEQTISETHHAYIQKTAYLTIPKLEIEKAKIQIGSHELNPKDFIGHLSGTALPGDPGTSFLYGHSVLPWFFNPDDYNTIFSTLHKLDSGDAFTIKMGEKLLSYEVFYKLTVDPEKVVPFINDSYLSNNDSWAILMTCTPPGLDTKRLLVIGKSR